MTNIPSLQDGSPAIEVRGLTLAFGAPGRWLPAVTELSFRVPRGRTFAVVGESGCGKSITALALAGLLPEAARVVAGEVRLLGRPVTGWSELQWRQLRGDRIGMVFQDPMSALNPVLTVGEQMVEAILAHRRVDRHTARAEALHLLEQVRMPNPARTLDDHPHQLSGGMRQRVMIAIAIANRPDILIADEPTTALDATVQAEILALLHEIQQAHGMTLVLITHDLSVVARWADEVMVMYAGRKVEQRPAAELLRQPAHPYTRALVQARPARRPAGGPRQRLAEIPGTVPAPGTVGSGCAFSGRCAQARPVCSLERPPAHAFAGGGAAWCHDLGPGWGHDSEALAGPAALAEAVP